MVRTRSCDSHPLIHKGGPVKLLCLFFVFLLFTTAHAFSSTFNGFGYVVPENSLVSRSIKHPVAYPAVLIHFDGYDENSRAIVLSCGHCYATGNIGVSVFKRPSVKTISLYSENGQHQFSTRTLLYWTVTEVELLLYELDITYKELSQRYGIKSHLLAQRPPDIGERITFVTSHRKPVEVQKCQVDNFVEDLTQTFWEHGIPNNRNRYKDGIIYYGCISVPGLSGSFLVSDATGEIFGTNVGGNSRYISGYKKFSFGMSHHKIYTCLDKNLKFDLELPTCELFNQNRN